MSRYFYIVFLLISIKCTICYNYYDVKSNHRYIGERDTGRLNTNPNVNQKRKFHGDNHQVAQFDVASFIQNAADNAMEDHGRYVFRTRNEYSDYGSLADANVDESIKMEENNQDNLRSDLEEAELVETRLGNSETSKPLDNINMLNYAKDGKPQGHEEKTVKKYRDEVPLHVIHNPEKKCAFRNMKFPFFSHNNSDKTKKQNRRKMFSFHNKKVESERSKPMEHSERQAKKKRSYEEKVNFCPACKRKFKKKNYDRVNRQKRVNDRTLHNSKQFYAALSEREKEKARNVHIHNNNDNEYSDIAIIDNNRSKREYTIDKNRRVKK